MPDKHAATSFLTGNCPCGSGKSYQECCAPLHHGDNDATDAAQLMRARYCAHALRLPTFLLASWHASTRPDSVDDDDDLEWTGLTVQEHRPLGAHEATVTFTAFFRTANGKPGSLQEKSRFVHEHGRWWYLDGERPKPRPQRREKTGRNAPCPCGSGRKFKHCCGR